MANELSYIFKLKDEATGTLKNFSNSTKSTEASFAGMAKGIAAKGAIVVAAITAVGTAMVKTAEAGGKMLDVQKTFDKLASNVGQSGDKLLLEFQKVTAGTVSNADLMQRSVKASMLGIHMDKMTALMQIAKTQATAMGEDVGYMLDFIVTGVGRASPLILDNLGITLKMGQVNEQYAASLGKTVEQLTSEEQKQAVLNAVIAWGAQKQQEMGGAIELSASSAQRLEANLINLKNNALMAVTPAINTVLEGIMSLATQIMNSKLVTDTLIPSFQALFTAFGQLITAIQPLLPYLELLAGFIGKILVEAIARFAVSLAMIISAIAQFVSFAIAKFNEFKPAVVGAIQSVITFISTQVGNFKNWGRNIAGAFVDGFKEKINSIKDAAVNAFNDAKRFLQGNSPPKDGPFKNIDTWGYNIGDAWVKGFQEALGGINLDSISNGNSSTTTYNQSVNVNAQMNNNVDAYSLGTILGQQLAFSGKYD